MGMVVVRSGRCPDWGGDPNFDPARRVLAVTADVARGVFEWKA